MSEQRLIDANKISLKDVPMDMGGLVFIEDVLLKLEELPIVDAVPIVRCKDCKHEQGCKNAQHLGMDGFCSYGERRG